ncbi:MAG TPA: ChaN family lipoprotein [Gemmatimonadaceae bacterium]
MTADSDDCSSPIAMSRLVRCATLGITIALGACARGTTSTVPAAPVAAGYQLLDAQTDAAMSMSALSSRVAESDIVVFGELHDDPGAHRFERDLLDATARLGRPVILSLEMFERDVQPELNAYLRDSITESQFLARTRPWPNYPTDYRPLIEEAKRRHWSVVAANVPRPLASAIGRRGLSALDTLTTTERGFAAQTLQCPHDAYHVRFVESMRSHPGSDPTSPADSLPTVIAERFYLAQCAKDETMAESIVAARRAEPTAIVLHYTGSFHSDYSQGTVERIRRREPGWRVLVVSTLQTPEGKLTVGAAPRGIANVIVVTRLVR